MATYKVGGLSPFNKYKSIHDVIVKARAGDEIYWNKQEKYTEAIYIRSGIHIIANHSRFKVPEHSIAIVLKGRGHVVLEGLKLQVTNLANAININEWQGTVELRDCEILYAKKMREDKAYPLLVTGKHQEDLNVIIKDSAIEGMSVSTGKSISIINSQVNGKIVHGVARGKEVNIEDSIVANSVIDASIYTHKNSTLYGRVAITSTEGSIKDSIMGHEESRAELSFRGNFVLSGVDFSGGIDSLMFEDGTVDLDNVSIPITHFVTKNSSVNIHANVITAGPWKQIDTKISNRTQSEIENIDTKSAIEDLNEMIGLSNVKSTIDNYVSLARVNKAREDAGMENLDSSLHLVFSGSPGTGKTTVANLFARALYEEGVLPSPNVVTATRRDLVSDAIGGTAIKTGKLIERAIGGVLFIDEAYELTASSEKDFAPEAVAELLLQMENHRHELVVILAGYTNQMKTFFDEGNPGLSSRFNNWVEFPDYSLSELTEIMKLSLMSKYELDARAMDSAELKLFTLHREGLVSGNARFVRNFIQEIVFAQSLRLNSNKDLSIESLERIELEDIESAHHKFKSQIEERNR